MPYINANWFVNLFVWNFFPHTWSIISYQEWSARTLAHLNSLASTGRMSDQTHHHGLGGLRCDAWILVYSWQVFSTNLFLNPTVVMPAPEGNRYLFANEGKTVSGGIRAFPKSVSQILGHGSLSVMTGEKHKWVIDHPRLSYFKKMSAVNLWCRSTSIKPSLLQKIRAWSVLNLQDWWVHVESALDFILKIDIWECETSLIQRQVTWMSVPGSMLRTPKIIRKVIMGIIWIC